MEMEEQKKKVRNGRTSFSFKSSFPGFSYSRILVFSYSSSFGGETGFGVMFGRRALELVGCFEDQRETQMVPSRRVIVPDPSFGRGGARRRREEGKGEWVVERVGEVAIG
jgi:hypothetical protein